MASATATTLYRLKAGNPKELIRDTACEDLGKLWERITRYQGRVGVTEILVTRHEARLVNPKNIQLGPPTAMIAMHRANEESPWTDIPLSV